MSRELLLGFDLEDINMMLPDRISLPSRVEMNTKRILAWLTKQKAYATFFTVGELALKFPDLVKEIIDHGHEIACHSFSHRTLNTFDQESFRKDLELACEALFAAGVPSLSGYRAPVFSMNASTIWVYDILKKLGFKYSSSVLPATKSLYAWPSFPGDSPVWMEQGILEIPMSVCKIGPFRLPFSGGVYLRSLPFALNKFLFKKRIHSKNPLVSYVHPYDFDPDEPRFIYPGLGNRTWINPVMYRNRQHTFARLEKMIEVGYRIVCYKDFAAHKLSEMGHRGV